jgi:hypothetical protein
MSNWLFGGLAYPTFSEGEGGEEGANEGGVEEQQEVEGVAEEDETPFIAAGLVDEGEHNPKVLSYGDQRRRMCIGRGLYR